MLNPGRGQPGLEAQLHDVLVELDNIRADIGRGLLTDLTKQMLDEAEARMRDPQARLEVPSPRHSFTPCSNNRRQSGVA